MSDATRILSAVDVTLPVEANDLAEAIDALTSCAAACIACADACLGEPDVEHMRSCIRADQACADLCEVTARFLTRTGGYDIPVVRNLLEATTKACSTSAEICEGHAQTHKHCRVCADTSRRAEQAVQRLLTQLAAAVI